MPIILPPDDAHYSPIYGELPYWKREPNLPPMAQNIETPYRIFEDGVITKVYFDEQGRPTRRYDVKVAGRDEPYEGIGTNEREWYFKCGDLVRIGFLDSDPSKPFIIGRNLPGSNAPSPGNKGYGDPHLGPTHKRRKGGGKKVSIAPGWLRWGADHKHTKSFGCTIKSSATALSNAPVPVFDAKSSGMLRTFETAGVVVCREETEEQTRFVIKAGDGSENQILYRFGSTWEPVIGFGDLGGLGPYPCCFSLSDDGRTAFVNWGAMQLGSWQSSNPGYGNPGGPACPPAEEGPGDS